MIDYNKGRLLDILPVNLKHTETECISYAIGKSKEKLVNYIAACSVYGSLETLPDQILDLIAVELGTQYYDQDMSTELKRQLITQTYIWYLHAGTPSVIEEFLTTVFDGGKVREWFDYGGEPYHFQVDVFVNESLIVPEDNQKIRRQLERCKNVRSWVEHLYYIVRSKFDVLIGFIGRLTMQSEFYPRYNLSYLVLDGSWNLNGFYTLNGYQDSVFQDFYPSYLTCRSEAVECLHSASGISAAIIPVHAEIEIEAQIEYGSELAINGRSVCKTLELQGSIRASPDMSGILTVEKDLWYLDGTYGLDGEKLLDAQIFQYVLEA